MPHFVTGAAGFVGHNLCLTLLKQGKTVIGLDNLSDYYDVTLKQNRLKTLTKFNDFIFYHQDLTDLQALLTLFEEYRPRKILHMAAQAGVRYSIENPHTYIQSNILGFLNVLEAARHFPPQHLLYASSSSVYGGNTKQPFAPQDQTNHPLSLYAATKKSAEMMAHSYSHLFHIPVTGVRYFTLYGPWGRPDMALWKFTKAILENKPIDIYNNGEMARDFTYIDDAVKATLALLEITPLPQKSPSKRPDYAKAPARIYNIGNTQPIPLMKMIETLEQELGQTALKNFMPMQAGDVHETYADITTLKEAIGFTPTTQLATGIATFVDWYKDYHALD